MAQEKVEEVKRWGMMQMGHVRIGGYGHKPLITSMKFSSNKALRQFSNVQGGLNLMMNPPLKGEESITLITTEDFSIVAVATLNVL
jgi:hypothetical protein